MLGHSGVLLRLPTLSYDFLPLRENGRVIYVSRHLHRWWWSGNGESTNLRLRRGFDETGWLAYRAPFIRQRIIR